MTYKLQKELHKTIKNFLKAGITEKELASKMDEVCKWQGDLISGVRASLIEGTYSDKVICVGDTVIADLQVFCDGKWSDITRTYFVGEPSNEMKYAYQCILNGIRAGEKLLKEGTKAEDIYFEVKKAVNHQYSFDHHAGHLLGEEPMLQPQFLPEKKELLKCKDRVTLEPGIYIPSSFGIRIENNYEITKTGFISLLDLSEDINDYICK